MARSLSNVRLLVDTFSLPIFLRRGYSVAANEAVSTSFGRGVCRSGMVGKVERRVAMKEDSGASSAWAPDPITGYYRPANCAGEIDPAELRETLLNHRVRPH